MKEEDLSNKSKELLEVSPYGKVPVVVVEGRAIYESAVIGEYLDEMYPQVRLMPEDPYERAQVRLWTDYSATRLVPPLYRIRKSKEPEKVEQSWPELHKELAYVERHLKAAEGVWFVGGAFGMADINFLPFIHQASQLEGDVLSGYPALKGWFEAFEQRESYKATITDV